MVKYDYLQNHARASEYLADKLCQGTVVMVLGSGASTALGLPDWPTLIARLLDACGIAVSVPADAPAGDLQQLADRVLREGCGHDRVRFASLVRSCLYEGVPLSDSVTRNELLIALGALMMGTKRGSVRRVVTFNFDSTLEWYLSLHGFVPRVVVEPTQLEGSEDVRVYHPHGFLPHPDHDATASDFVILGLKDVNLRVGKDGDLWIASLRHLLRTGVAVVVGLSPRSLRDPAIATVVAVVSEEVNPRRPTGFWLLTQPETSAVSGEFLDNNMVPVFFGDHSEIPGFLLSICRRAALATVVD